MKTILITGGTGLMGKGIEEVSHRGFNIVITHIRDYQPKGNSIYEKINVLDINKMSELFERYNFDAVVHCAGINNVDYVEKNITEARKSNIEGTKNIIKLCKKYNAYLIYVSTNAVFDGNNAPYSEEQKVCPINEYGKIKVECENNVIENSVIVRPILMYGWNRTEVRKNPVSWIVEALKEGKKLKLVDDVFENPVYNLEVGKVIWRILKLKPSGVIHIAGKDIINRYDFGLKIAKVFNLDESLIERVDSSSFTTIAPRPKDTSFTTKRMEALVPALGLEEGLKDMLAKQKFRTCSMEGCERKHFAKGYCIKHYTRMRTGFPMDDKICQNDGCERKVLVKDRYICSVCYHRALRQAKVENPKLYLDIDRYDRQLLEKSYGEFEKEKFIGNGGKCETCNERDICLDLNKEYKWCVEAKLKEKK